METDTNLIAVSTRRISLSGSNSYLGRGRSLFSQIARNQFIATPRFFQLCLLTCEAVKVEKSYSIIESVVMQHTERTSLVRVDCIYLLN